MSTTPAPAPAEAPSPSVPEVERENLEVVREDTVRRDGRGNIPVPPDTEPSSDPPPNDAS